MGKVQDFPVKSKKVKAQDLKLHYYYIRYRNQFLIKQRDDSFIWKKLYDFPEKFLMNLKNGLLTKKQFIIN
jgi:A/G-specific adenine glycosylase